MGPLQDAAALAADILISPITPEILSAREFKDGTMELLDQLEPSSALGPTLGLMKAVIYRQDRTNDVALNWSNKLALNLGRWPNIKPYVARVAARPKVQETMRAEGLTASAGPYAPTMRRRTRRRSNRLTKNHKRAKLRIHLSVPTVGHGASRLRTMRCPSRQRA